MSPRPDARKRVTRIVGGNVRRYREQIGLSQSELAERMGDLYPDNGVMVSKWELGDRMIDVDILDALATALELQPADLLNVETFAAERRAEAQQEAAELRRRLAELDAEIGGAS